MICFVISTLVMLMTFAQAEDTTIKNVTPEQAEKMLKEKKVPVIIDIRTLGEFSKGHLKGATLIDYRKDFSKKLAKLDREQAYIFHCQSGGRSTQSLPVWKQLGFKNVSHLNSGYLGWQKAKLPVVIPEKK